MRPAHRLDFAYVGKLLWPETGSLCRDGKDLEAQPGLEFHDKQAAGTEVEPRVRTD
jgi:hypothetical protein